MEEERKLSILIVDDDNFNIDVLSRILAERYKILVAKNGPQAVKIAHDAVPDLIMLDIIMPGMDGYEVLAGLKKSEQTKGIPVIFITGQDSREDEIKGLTLGAVDYIAKPIHSLVVEARVNTHMRSLEQMRTIKRLSTIDELTSLPNRRYFNDQMNKEWGRAIRETAWLSLLIIDIDHFKQYNDAHGFPQGDTLLKAVGGVCGQALKRAADVVARWGGEEFTLLLPRTDTGGAMDVAERIRKSIEDLVIPCADGTPTKTTVSVGINAEQPIVSEKSSVGFVSRAGKALGMAKKSGRNRVCVYKPDGSEDAVS
ncbi:MAG: diguanylate cyclase [Chitinispirillia bacterium]|nr:diguanylate cyclase [Chitinispirillia bacterium]MCL2241626.1 diguanylate cyclase [Chitinispirillia bacterium]